MKGLFFTKKTRMVLCLLAVMVFALSFSGCKKSKELKLAHFFPANHPAETELVAKWAEAISEATNGEVKIDSYPSNNLISKAKNIYSGVKDGIADIGLSCFSYTPGIFPVMETFELPGTIYNTSKSASMVAWEAIKQLDPVELQDTKVLMVFSTGPGHLITKTAVNTLEDLKNLEIRATGISVKALTLLGASPNGMAQSETYDSLSKGIVKGNISPLEVLKGWNQAEVTSHVTFTPFLYNNLFFITMNKDVWESFSSETQNIIEEISESFLMDVAIGLWDTQNDEAIEWAVNEKGISTITLTDEESAKWIEIVNKLQDEHVKALNDKGLDGDKVLSTLKSLAQTYNEMYK